MQRGKKKKSPIQDKEKQSLKNVSINEKKKKEFC